MSRASWRGTLDGMGVICVYASLLRIILESFLVVQGGVEGKSKSYSVLAPYSAYFLTLRLGHPALTKG
jgi:hypothetical protein